MAKRTKRKSKRTSKSKQGKALPRIVFVALAFFAAFVLAGGVGAQFENHDSFCASCHTQPESTYYQRSLDTQAVDLATAHADQGIRCIDCHSGSGVGGRIQAMMVGANDAVHFITHAYTQPATQKYPIKDANCLKCHAGVSQKQDFNNHFHVFLPQWQKIDPNAATCVDCHQGHATNGDPTLGFLNKATTVAVCEHCHSVAGEGGE